MEKRAIIAPGITPPEHKNQKLPQEKQSCVQELDDDLRKRLATKVADKSKEA
jgi:hypothetical protein